nr:5-formyltetrahydrofolate cyclo-ligase [Acinetobacter populi]
MVTGMNTLRKDIRKQRRTLSRYALAQAAQKILFQASRHPKIRSARRIGIYLDAFGEVPTRALIFALLKQHKKVYLPVICPMNQHLLWQEISIQQMRNQRFTRHQLGMKQAVQHRALNISHLDLLIMPLVVFDQLGQRIGMGGGFYDRTLAMHPHLPYRLGLAHDFQKSKMILKQQKWDQKLNTVLTPTRHYNFR